MPETTTRSIGCRVTRQMNIVGPPWRQLAISPLYGKAVTLKNDKGVKSVNFYVDDKTIFCIGGRKVSIDALSPLIGETITTYNDVGAKPSTNGRIYAFKIEDGDLTFGIDLAANHLTPVRKPCK